ncbi:MAG: AmmeMemoRadiSam system protein B [Planctomycetota bacterium]
MNIRRPAVAGSFYPSDPDQLTVAISQYLKNAPQGSTSASAFILPHAGYMYSGSVAASAYAQMNRIRDQVSRVVLLGPAHRMPIHGLAASGADRWATPLGEVAVNRAAIEELAQLPFVSINDAAHEFEHCLEVHLPFLQSLLPDVNSSDGEPKWTMVPLIGGEVTASQVCKVIEMLWNPPQTMVIVSSDLSHFLDYNSARKMDAQTARAIETLHPDDIRSEQACGGILIKGLLQFAAQHNLRPKTIDLRNSGDTVGPRDCVVGYGTFVFTLL